MHAVVAAALVAVAACGPHPPLPPLVGGSPRVRITSVRPLPADLDSAIVRAGLDAQRHGVWPPDTLAVILAQAGHLRARVCAQGDSLWRIDAGREVTAVRYAWHSASQGVGIERLGLRAYEHDRRDGLLHPRIEDQVARALRACDEADRPLARIALADFQGDSSLALDFEIDGGPVVRIAEVRFEGLRTTRAGYLRRVIGWHGPESYRHVRWSSAHEELSGTGLLDVIEGPFFVLGEDAAPGPRPDSVDVRILFRVRERAANRISGLLAYSAQKRDTGGTAGVTGFLDLTLGNLFGTGRAAHMAWQRLGEDHSLFELDWREPFLWKLPIGAALALRQSQEDTLYAETLYGADLLWRPAATWRASIGWRRSRLVLGAQLAQTVRRETTRFGLQRESAVEAPTGWTVDGEVARTQAPGATFSSVLLESSAWLTRGHWVAVLEQQGGLLAPGDSVLRGDAFSLGGARTLRGRLEGEFRASRFALGRFELGPRLDVQGARVYALCDIGWFDLWQPVGSGLHGVRGPAESRWSAGAGLQIPTRAGRMRLEYAVPGGEALGRGRLHFWITGMF